MGFVFFGGFSRVLNTIPVFVLCGSVNTIGFPHLASPTYGVTNWHLTKGSANGGSDENVTDGFGGILVGNVVLTS